MGASTTLWGVWGNIVVCGKGDHFTHPTLTDIWMTLDSVRQRGFAQMAPSSFLERKLDVVPATTVAAQDVGSQGAHTIRHIHLLEVGVIADALEEWYAVPRTLSSSWA